MEQKIGAYHTEVISLKFKNKPTNGDMIKAAFPDAEIKYHAATNICDAYYAVKLKDCDIWQDYPEYWWNAPYERGSEE